MRLTVAILLGFLIGVFLQSIPNGIVPDFFGVANVVDSSLNVKADPSLDFSLTGWPLPSGFVLMRSTVGVSTIDSTKDILLCSVNTLLIVSFFWIAVRKSFK
jgi:hypothetical protein